MTTNTTVNFKRNDNYLVPSEVLSTALQTINRSFYIYQTWESNATVEWYVYFHFAELQVLQSGQVREFQVYVQGNALTTVSPEYLKPITTPTPSPLSGTTIIYNVSSTKVATLPPFINAMEILYAIGLPNPLTYLGDGTVFYLVNYIYVKKNCSPDKYCFHKTSYFANDPRLVLSIMKNPS